MAHIADIQGAAQALSEGKLVAFPTETVYGLGGDATSDQAVAAIFAAKGRPSFNPLIMHVESLEAAFAMGRFDPVAEALARRFWPGPLTLVVPKAAACPVSLLATAGLESIALRVPAHPAARELLKAFGKPIAAPSANISGRLSPTRAEHVRSQLEAEVAVILDLGESEVGLESTIVSCLTEPPSLLRPGGLSREDIETAIGTQLAGSTTADGLPLSPGQLQHHYAPQSELRLNARRAEAGEALLAFGNVPPGHNGPMLNLSPTRDTTEAAANLFAFLHQLDGQAATIAVMPVPNSELGEAINDRLVRAAASGALDVI